MRVVKLTTTQPYQVMLRGNDGSLETSITVFDKVVARVEGFPRYTSIKELRASLIGRRGAIYVHADFIFNLIISDAGTWLSVRGTVVRISSVKPLVTQMEFTCGTCSQGRIVVFEDGKFAPPTSMLDMN